MPPLFSRWSRPVRSVRRLACSLVVFHPLLSSPRRVSAAHAWNEIRTPRALAEPGRRTIERMNCEPSRKPTQAPVLPFFPLRACAAAFEVGKGSAPLDILSLSEFQHCSVTPSIFFAIPSRDRSARTSGEPRSYSCRRRASNNLGHTIDSVPLFALVASSSSFSSLPRMNEISMFQSPKLLASGCEKVFVFSRRNARGMSKVEWRTEV